MTAVTPDLSTIDALKAQIACPVSLPSDDGYAAEIAGFNLAHTHAPTLAVGATSTADVAAAVKWAAAQGLPIAVHSTGHGSVQSYQNCLLVNTSRTNEVAVDPAAGTARLGAGVRWRAVIDAAGPHGLAPLNGSSSSAGVVGYTTGGGLPVMGRTFGFSADNVVEFEIVSADGVVRRCNADSETDLFWAVRGGKGNFGIVTSLTVQLQKVSTVYGGAIYFDGPAAPQLFAAYREWVETLPEEMSTSLALMRLPDLPFVPPPLAGKLTVHLRACYVGDPAEGERLLAPIRALDVPVIMDMIQQMPYMECDAIHHDPEDPLPAWDSGITLRDFPTEALDALMNAAGPDVELPLVMVELRHLGGALARQPASPNAVAGRDGKFSFGCVGAMFPGLEEIVPGLGRAMLETMRPWAGAGKLVNFLGDQTSKDEVAASWPAETYQRLMAIKSAVDPLNLFRHGHALDPVVVLPEQARSTE